ncbi:hypothetical protein DRQ09_05420, partial [candidate division KSB1 bacterium]
IIIVALFLFCKKSGTNETYGLCKVEGTVYLDNQPYAGAEVEYGFAVVRGSTIGTELVWTASQIIRTDNNGYYSFSRKQVNDRYDYRVRAKHPIKGYWSEHFRGTIMGGTTKTHNFSFTSE